MNLEYLYIVNNFLPEIVLVALGLLVLAVDLFLPKTNQRRALAIFAAVGCLVAAGLAVQHWIQGSSNSPYSLGNILPIIQTSSVKMFRRRLMNYGRLRIPVKIT